MKKRLQLIILIMICGIVAKAQLADRLDTLNLKPWQLKRLAEHAEQTGDCYSAIDYYQKYLEAKPAKIRATMHLADNYRKARDYKNANKFYQVVFNSEPTKYPMAHFYHALMIKMGEGSYDEALELLNDFKKTHKKALSDKDLKKWMYSEMEGCEQAKDLWDWKKKMSGVHLDTSINKAHIELSPYPINDTTIIYSSLRTDQIDYYMGYIMKPVKHFYVAKKRNNNWYFDGEMEGQINIGSVNTGNGTISPDGQRFYFTRCFYKNNGKLICSIFKSTMQADGKWSKATKLSDNVNTPNHTTTQPTVGVDPKSKREVLYFISDRIKTKGGLDLWYSVWDPKKEMFRKAKNAGSKVNTVKDELTPYYDNSTKTLYLSSEGKAGLGGMDIYKHTGYTNKWTPGINMGAPINSKADDIYYVLATNREDGFFVSNREGGVALINPTCCDDIYFYHDPEYLRIDVIGKVFQSSDTALVIDYKDDEGERDLIHSEDNESKRPAEGAEVELHIIDKETGEHMFITSTFTDKDGAYRFDLEADHDYVIVSHKEGFFNDKTEVNTLGFEKSQTIYARGLITHKIPKEAIVVKNVNYPFDKHHLTFEAKKIIDHTILEVLLDNPQIIIEVSAHTDSKGSSTYNRSLSDKRAHSVVKYLYSKGIANDRLKDKGYGEDNPIAPNENADGTDNEEGRAKNRRTEFKVIGELEVSEVIYED